MSATFPSSSDYFYRGAAWNGSTYPGSPGGPPFDGFTTALTICGLGYHYGTSSGNYQPLMAMSSQSAGGNYFFLGNQPSGVSPNYGPDFGWSPPGGSAFDISGDTWIQWAIWTDQVSGNSKAYWKYIGDVTWQATYAWTSVFNFTSAPKRLFFGADEYSNFGNLWMVSNARIWTAALSDAEVLAEVNSTTLIRTANIWAWYKFKAGALTQDSSGQGNHLLANGAPTAGADSPLEAPGSSPPRIITRPRFMTPRRRYV